MAALGVLHQLLDDSARVRPDHTAVEEPGNGMITYGQLAALSDRLRDRLHRLGVGPVDRVGIYMRKSIDAVVAIFGILKTGAAYVPVDPNAPAARNAYILNNCSVKAVLVENRFVERLQAEIEQLGVTPAFVLLEGAGGGRPLKKILELENGKDPASPTQSIIGSPDDLAYILYTSGSTGKPKGVMLSHRNAISFISWASDAFKPHSADRFSSHAPLHFDLSILDVFLSMKHGATLVLIGEEIGKDPARLAPLIADQHLSIWYSAPSILSLLAQYANLRRYDYSSLRLVLFAGEVFPVKHLRLLQSLLPGPRYFNLYGPTETNVCTYYEIPSQIPAQRTEPFPIGKACSHLRTSVVDERGQAVPSGQDGELCVSGPGVMQGYWNLPDQTARAFLQDHSDQQWYKTGDIVVEAADGNYLFLGRRDRMVKRRGYRVELGEIEVALYRHPAVREVAVIALPSDEGGMQIKAFLSCHEAKHPSQVELKRFCAENLPLYMVPDLFSFPDSLPKTSTDKIDYQGLKEMA
jgi:amino acid adenylation domain-containing protein